jgi:hypothetical protein
VKQVLVTVGRDQPQTSRASLVDALVQWLEDARESGENLEYNALGEFGQVAVRAEPRFLKKLADKPEVMRITDDESVDAW